VQIWSLGGLVASLFKVLPVEIWSWNLAHRFRTLNEALGIFLGSGSFLVASVWGSKGTLWPLSSERLGRDGKLKFCRQLPWFNLGPRNFIQLHRSIGCTLISIFLGQVQKSQSFLIRLLTIFHKFQENFKRKLKWSNWVFIEFYRIWHLRLLDLRMPVLNWNFLIEKALFLELFISWFK
jgi:hypothetical protein